MTIILLVVALGDFPFLMFGKLGTFDTMKECRAHIANVAPEKLRPRLQCLQVVSEDEKESKAETGGNHG